MTRSRIVAGVVIAMLAGPAISGVARSGALVRSPFAVPTVPVENASIEIGPHDDPDHPDTRDSIVRIGSKLGLSAADIDQIRKSTGYLVCKGPHGHPEQTRQASGALVISNQEIITNSHVFRDVVELQGIGALDRCIFESEPSDDPKDWKEIPILNEPGSIVYNDDPDLPNLQEALLDRQLDWAVARLAEPVKGAKPLPVDTFGRILEDGDFLIGISASQFGMQTSVSPLQPVAQPIYVWGAPDQHSNGVTIYWTDADFGGQGSGGINIAKIEGKWTIKAIFAGGSLPWTAVRRAGPNSASWSVGLDGDFLKAVLDLDARYAKGGEH